MIDQHGTLEIWEARLRHNLDLLRAKLPRGTIICATTKADAYGHGQTCSGYILRRANVFWRCTYTIGEAIPIARSSGNNVLALAPFSGAVPRENFRSAEEFGSALVHRVRFTFADIASARHLNAWAEGAAGAPEKQLEAWIDGATVPEKIPVHVQIDTGLTRSGVSMAEAPAFLRQLLELPRIQLEGIYTHLSHGDEAGHSSVAEQIAALHKIADPIKREHPDVLIHAQNSGGTWNFSDASLDMVRIGIAMYGLQPSLDDPIPGLLPIARLIAPILMIHERPPNTGVGYGHTFTTQRASRLAIVPVGYADGYPRAMSNRGIVQVRGQNAPVVGRVSMDQIIVDVTDIAGAAAGDEVTVFSNDPTAPNCIDQIAKACGTIGYEIATGLGARLARRIVD